MTEKGLGKVGVYVDVENIARNGGYGMRYDVLREFASRDYAEPLRLNAYVAYDETRAETDEEYRERTTDFHSILRDFGYKVIEKKVMWYTDDSGNRFGKANADLDMAVDVILQSKNLDRIIIATGDGDFIQVVRALQNKGCRVEIIAFENVSNNLRKEADIFLSGYLIPELLSPENSDKDWGELGSRVRGSCYSYFPTKNYGFMRFLDHIGPGIWIMDTRREDSPFKTAFVHDSEFPDDIDLSILPSRLHIFEFELAEGDKGLQAKDIELVHCY